MADGLIAEYRLRARRLSLVCELVETFPDAAERKGVVMRLWETGMLSDGCASLLIEHYQLEAA